MNEKRRALGRGLGALIPAGPSGQSAGGTYPRPERPVDVFFGDGRSPEQSEVDSSPELRTGQEAGPADEPGTVLPAGSDGLRPIDGVRYAEIPVVAIRANPRQPRQVFDEDQLAELATSVAQIGVLQPVVVRPLPLDDASTEEHRRSADDATTDAGSPAPIQYELVMGERRWRAATAAGLTHIPAIIKATEDDALLRDALLENLHRAQLNPLEEAAAYQQLLDDFGCSHEELAERIGRSRPQISNTIRLLKLPPLVARRLAAGVLSAGHARALLALPDAAAMERLAQRIVAEGLSVRTVEEIVALGAAPERTKSRTSAAVERPPRLDQVAHRLADRLDTRVQVDLGRRRGRLTVEFATLEDLDRIAALLGIDQDDAPHVDHPTPTEHVGHTEHAAAHLG